MFVRILFVPLESGSESRRTLTEIRRKSEAIKSCNVHTVETFRCSKLSLYGNHLQRAKDLTSRGGTPFCFLFLFFTSYSLLRFVHCLSCFLSFCFANVFVVSNSAKWVLIVCVCVCASWEGGEGTSGNATTTQASDKRQRHHHQQSASWNWNWNQIGVSHSVFSAVKCALPPYFPSPYPFTRYLC